jgi:hypothetical protein
LDIFPILKNYRNAGHFSGHFAQRKSVFPGVEMQWRSGSCSANVPGHDVVAMGTWLQCWAFR